MSVGGGGLLKYMGKRAVDRIAVVLSSLTLQFLLLRVLPYYVLGIDPSFFFLNPNLTEAQRELIRKQFGLDESLASQFVKYVLSLFTGNMGFSFYTRRPVFSELMERLPNTVLLLGTATVLTIIIGLIVGIIAVSKRGTRFDASIIGSSIFVSAFPLFYVGLLLLLIFGFYLRWFPIAGTISRPPPRDPVIYVADLLRHMALPLITLLITGIGGFALFIRNLFLTQLGEDYVLTARAKGLNEREVMVRHVLRNVLAPVINILALEFPGIISGAVIVETVFSWYGVGRWLFQAATQFDYPVVQAVLFIQVALTVVSLYIADLIIALIDPRVRLR
ncbi:MAG: ABC transporter permease [archaeon GB-1845-036]|nr:ABC transporter permease [Candidatus Verstraetearchaeota archaeon]MCS7373519.1 ABC transporter permease [Candidatus Culexmicrobium thermophilum]HDO20808.1 ABC transporter permease [Candidatus Bathyarchaeota archaeon]